MTRRELTDQELHDFRRIVQPKESVFDDPEWVRLDNERWLAAREREEEMRRTHEDPYFRRLREKAVEATGGESCNPDRDPELSEEGR